MWIVSGPMSIVPVPGEGMEAMRLSMEPHSACLRDPCLEKNASSKLGGAAAFHELDRVMEIDVRSLGELDRLGHLESGPNQLRRTPANDPFELSRKTKLGVDCAHLSYLDSLIGAVRIRDVTRTG